jgi:tRNA (guanine-N7-)-methyltransferase
MSVSEIENRPPGELRSFGRLKGRKLSARQSGLLRELLPRLSVDLSAPPPAPLQCLFESEAAPLPVDIRRGAIREVWLEIGFGGAEHMVWQAKRNPHAGVIGCEPFEEGVAKALTAISEAGLDNVRLHAGDARPLLRWLPPGSLSRAFILFPDPWPKTRHRKRRLVSGPLLDLLFRAMKPAGELRVATDIGDYAGTILQNVARHGGFRWLAEAPGDWRERPANWPPTRYEQKAIKDGRQCYFFRFVRSESAGAK